MIVVIPEYHPDQQRSQTLSFHPGSLSIADGVELEPNIQKT
jgi:hypothetical protein